MVAATLQTKFVIIFLSLVLFSCQNKIAINENELINGLEISRYIRTNEFSGSITIMYLDNETLKSKRYYKKGKKNGHHQGWWPNGTKKYSFHFKHDMSVGAPSVASKWKFIYS